MLAVKSTARLLSLVQDIDRTEEVKGVQIQYWAKGSRGYIGCRDSHVAGIDSSSLHAGTNVQTTTTFPDKRSLLLGI
jgi:hypothetical protein